MSVANPTVFYAATTRAGEQVLLLGPFQEKALALQAVEPARDLLYQTVPDLGPVPPPVEVTAVTVGRDQSPPAGRLNSLAIALLGRA
ncbi:hypothetical protein CHO01_22910 [Cellulomonas hominis]|uniref:Uncharacterized protein n=1 Tax=Cellulomonas hominis TaxID=156981 RepID=A0A511FD43_9CELL|nr:hypothetical protein [Cellulomonas hominis]MBB5474621.1 hypothetical protein [Cellulomonas hominis]NKY06260.1 hypothetical protein [Cellulomonas hominis]GEL47175.1 hypothetical protein CHO01_22910 [Cellulomonas hominis]